MHKTARRRILAALLILLQLPVAAACTDTGSAPAGETTTAAAVTTAAPETEYKEQPELPAQTYNGRKLVFLDGNKEFSAEWYTKDIFAENMTAEPINDAVWTRNDYIQNKYDVIITEYGVKDVEATLSTSIRADEKAYDAVVSPLNKGASMTVKNYLVEYSDLPYVDLERSWWDSDILAGLTIANKTCLASGDLLINDNDATFGIMFNKEMAENLQLGNLYTLVDDMKWTFDRQEEMMQLAKRDLNGDGELVFDQDTFGFACGTTSIRAYFYAAGLTIVTKDKEDMPQISFDVEKSTKVLEYLHDIVVDPAIAYNYNIRGAGYSTVTQLFGESRALFYGGTLQEITRLRPISTIEFGVIPYPLFDEEQDRYYSHTHYHGTVVAVPTTNDELEMTSVILEDMAYKSKELLTPAYYDITLIGKGLRDEESEPMIDLILKTRVYDLGYIFDWGGYHSAIQTLAIADSTALASAVASAAKLFDKSVKKTLAAFDAD